MVDFTTSKRQATSFGKYKWLGDCSDVEGKVFLVESKRSMSLIRKAYIRPHLTIHKLLTHGQ